MRIAEYWFSPTVDYEGSQSCRLQTASNIAYMYELPRVAGGCCCEVTHWLGHSYPSILLMLN